MKHCLKKRRNKGKYYHNDAANMHLYSGVLLIGCTEALHLRNPALPNSPNGCTGHLPAPRLEWKSFFGG